MFLKNGVEYAFHPMGIPTLEKKPGERYSSLCCTLLLGPYEPVPGCRVAIIQDGDVPIEFVQTSLSDEELWGRAKTESILYADDAQQSRQA
jgi:hypothetical protein